MLCRFQDNKLMEIVLAESIWLFHHIVWFVIICLLFLQYFNASYSFAGFFGAFFLDDLRLGGVLFRDCMYCISASLLWGFIFFKLINTSFIVTP